MKKLAILGSTGSIGHSTLSICESFPDRYQVISLAAGTNVDVAASDITEKVDAVRKALPTAAGPLAMADQPDKLETRLGALAALRESLGSP